MNREWTPEELDVIRADTRNRISRVVTAAKLGRPVAATRTRALMIGAVMQPHSDWMQSEVDLLKAMFRREGPLPTDREIEAALGRKPTSFRPKLVELGLVGPRRFRDDLRASPEALSSRRKGAAAAVRGTKTRDALAARAERKAARVAAKAAQAEAVSGRRAARAQAKAEREARLAAERDAKAAARRVASERAAADRAARAEAAKAAARAMAGSRAVRLRPAPVPAVPRPAPARAAPAAASRAAMRAALDRVAARRLGTDPERAAAAEARLLAMLGGR